ncbi:HCNGP-like protein-domain-containing protein [Clohesyomyces aquaticus]|uniref:HCNGP-like protein-domain-containing protein n=1 Tax=Clohesyomyces aquaticus TaxID=1231657 RepID=A0A1Y1ZMH0_9PLEO|nr:HCNGP-like protein-domain-containing protein [Clohesyomyces aquaticus]
MLGIDYESSDDEDAPVEATLSVQPKVEPPARGDGAPEGPPRPSDSSPSQGPTIPASSGENDTGENAAVPQSPYSSYRSVVQSLTLPAVPSFDIPPSPPGSPRLAPTKKFATFLDMKKKGQHFNKRMESSSALQNPAHFQRLMGFAGLKEEDQYATTLPAGIAVPTTFPKSAYVEQLLASQKEITKEKEISKAQRETIDFVSAASSGASRKPPTTGKRPADSATERIMASLDRDRSSSTSSRDRDKRRELERRGGRDERGAGNRLRSRSRSPRRKRSRSPERERDRGNRASRWGP